MATPLFVLFGEVMARGGLGLRIFLSGQACVGWLRSRLAHANVVASMLFDGISGAATADTAAIGSFAIPAMRRVGYPAGLSAAVNAASSIISIIIPPSTSLIVYGGLIRTPTDHHLPGGFILGLLVGVSLMAVPWRLSGRCGCGERKPFQISMAPVDAEAPLTMEPGTMPAKGTPLLRWHPPYRIIRHASVIQPQLP
ncbi:MAG TPA: TRAP transporter large permease subunit [Roseococcus sp.]|nr:TRAP transporter large permease subunit [Roseococcus sp.]